jgi:ribosomal protein L29
MQLQKSDNLETELRKLKKELENEKVQVVPVK